MNHILKQLRAEVEQGGVGYRPLARMSGYGASQIRCWLTGRNDPRSSSMIDLANALGFDVVLVRREPERKAG